jgi:hypothetical protein
MFVFVSEYVCLSACVCISVSMSLCLCGSICTGGRQNNRNTKKLRNRICVGYIERTSVGNTESCFSVCLHSVVFVSVH